MGKSGKRRVAVVGGDVQTVAGELLEQFLDLLEGAALGGVGARFGGTTVLGVPPAVSPEGPAPQVAYQLCQAGW